MAFPELTFTLGSGPSSRRYLICTQKVLRWCPPAGMVSVARIVTDDGGEYDFQVSLKSVDSGTVQNDVQFLSVCDKISNHKFCPGIDFDLFTEKYTTNVRYELKGVRITTEPFRRVDSTLCKLWHKLARNSSIFEKDMDDVMCQPCKKMLSHLDQRVRASLAVTPTNKISRQQPSSRCPISALSPASAKKRRDNMMVERCIEKKKLRKYENTEVSLDDDQSDQMAEVVDIINDKSSDTLSKMFDEAESQGKGTEVKEIWANDLRADKKEFDKDQEKNSKIIPINLILITSILHQKLENEATGGAL